MTAANSYMPLMLKQRACAQAGQNFGNRRPLCGGGTDSGSVCDLNPALPPHCAGDYTADRITDDLVREAPEVEAVIGELVKFCGELPLLGHNISFDYSFLQQAAVNAGLKLPANVLDTLGCAGPLCRRESPKTSARPAPGTAFPRRRPTGPRRTPSALISFTRSSWDSTEWSGRSCLPPGRWKFV